MYLRYGLIRKGYDVRYYFEGLDFRPEIKIFYGLESAIDSIHAQRLQNIPKLELIGIPGSDHDAVKELRQSGELKQLLKAACDNILRKQKF